MHTSSILKNSHVYALFAISGATALIYQIIWSRWLMLVFGNTTISSALILATFMTGLAIGSWAAGHVIGRFSNPMRVYAALELGIGVFALLFPLATGFVEALFAAVVSTESPAIASLAIRAILSCILLSVPTVLMGGTLPFLTEYFRRCQYATRSWKVGLLYAANTFGAVVGVFLAGFILIELLGVRRTNELAALLNMLVATAAYTMFKTPVSLGAPEPTRSGPSSISGALALCMLAVSGALGMASEVLWTRTLESLVGNSTYAFSLIVLLYLVGIATGSWVMSLMVARLGNPILWLAGLQLFGGVWLIAAIQLFLWMAGSLIPFRGTDVTIFFLLEIYLKVMLILLPSAFFSGACFPLATRIIDPDSMNADGVMISRAYGWNTIGAVVGALTAGFLIAPLFDYLGALYLLALFHGVAALAVAWMLWVRVAEIRGGWVKSLATMAFCLAVAAGWFVFRADSFADHINRNFTADEVVFHEKGIQGVTTAIRVKNQTLADRLLLNGMGMTSKVTEEKMMAHLPMLLHPSPRNTLVVCFGMGTTYRSAISHGMDVTVVELVKEAYQAFDQFHSDAALVRSYPKGRMLVNDGRNYLKLTREKFDVITIDPPPPVDAAGVNSLYSLELMKLARSRLKPGGVFAHWLPFPGMSGMDEFTFEMIFRTFLDAFPYVYVQTAYNNFGLHVIGSMVPCNPDPVATERRFAGNVVRDAQEWDPVPLAYVTGVQFFVKDNVRSEQLTDDKPLLEFYFLRMLKSGETKLLADSFW